MKCPNSVRNKISVTLIWPRKIYGCKAWTVNVFEGNLITVFEM